MQISHQYLIRVYVVNGFDTTLPNAGNVAQPAFVFAAPISVRVDNSIFIDIADYKADFTINILYAHQHIRARWQVV